MPVLSEFEYGGSQTEINNLMTALQTQVANISAAINDVTSIKTAVDANWVGTSKEKFLSALSLDVQNLDSVINQLVGTLGVEFSNVMKVMQEHDLQMFKE